MKLKDFKDARKKFRPNSRRKEREIKEARESKIAYQELYKAAEIFEEDPDARSSDWISARRFVDWRNLHNLPTTKIIEKVIKFLNNWGCYLYTEQKNYPKMAEKIKEAYRKSIPFLEALENETLEDLKFEKKTSISGKEYTNKEILHEVFTNFCQVGYKFRGVAASKVLSLINPYLFVMWDMSICKAYGIRDPSEPYMRDKQYVPKFIPLMQEKANSVIDSYMKDKKCSREEAVKAINSFREQRPLAKLLDEYNWMKYYQKI